MTTKLASSVNEENTIMFKAFQRLALLSAVVCGIATTGFSAEPYNLCNSYVGYACVTPFLLNTNDGQGKGDYPVEVTPSGGSETIYYTNSSGQSQGYIVLIGPTGSSWLIAPDPSPCSGWSPSYQNVTDNIGYDPNNPGGTVLVPSFSDACST
jgi:hypothetical protein